MEVSNVRDATVASAQASSQTCGERSRVDPSGWRMRLSDEMIAGFRRSGEWSDTTLGERLDRLAAAHPDRLTIVDGDHRLTARQLRTMAIRLASSLKELGLAAGDVVSFQLPNWHEAVLVELACAYGGYVCNPIVPILRAHDVSFILDDARSKVLFIPGRFRGFDYPAMVQSIRQECPRLGHVFTVRGEGASMSNTAFATLLTAGPDEASPPRPDPNHVKLLLYTSGTTSRPKGVLHSHNTIDAETRNFAEHLHLGANDVVLMPSTLCHITGYLYAIQLPITLGARAILMESWDAAAAASLIDQHNVTFTIGATPFIQELAAYADRHGSGFPSLRYFPTGGAPVPPSVIRLAEQAFDNCCSFRVYGSTEAPTVTLGSIDDPNVESRAATEGVVVGHQVRLVGDDGRPVSPGSQGEIATRGPEMFLAYADWDQTLEAFDSEGFFRTGDLARFTDDGYLVVTGRKKDMIIRGGENISPKEVEDVISTHPAVRTVAVVGMPHPRLGETGCAFVALAEGASLDLDLVRTLLAERGMAKQKWPERLVVLPELPHTASGKVKKESLRQWLRDGNGTGESRSAE